jgi:ribosomal protein L11 methyltransferase
VIRLAVRVRRAESELVLAELLELAPGGVEEVSLDAETVEYAVYGAPGELPSLPDLRAAAGPALVEISTSETADDWQDRWRRFHRPVTIERPPSARERDSRVPAMRVRPPWEPPVAATANATAGAPLEEIVIDPGQAFGTGAHDTTRLCLELLLELARCHPAPAPLLDVGTGSGVLAIAAARLGFGPVLGLDNDRESVAAARKNAAANGVGIEVRRVDLRTEKLPWLDRGDAPSGRLVVVANLLRSLLLALAARTSRAPAHLIAGGLLHEHCAEVAAAFERTFGMRERERRQRGTWAAVWLSSPDAGSAQAGSDSSVAARTIER